MTSVISEVRSLSVMTNLWILVLGLAVVEASRDQKQRELRIVPVTEPHVLSEGPHWDRATQVLYFVDITSQKIMRLNPRTSEVTEAYIKNGPVGVFVPVAGRNNTFWAGSGTDLVEVQWNPKYNDPNPRIRVLSRIDKDRNFTRFNDGKVDPAGRFWAGSLGSKGNQALDNLGSLYRFSPNGTPTRIISPVSISNGLCWSHDNSTFYYIDSPTLQVVAYNYNVSTGNISNKRVVFTLKKIHKDEVPDGMTIDAQGHLWVAIHSGGRVIQVDPKTGKEIRAVKLPVMAVTSVAFGGPNLDVLYVTSGREGLSRRQLRRQPLAGSVFAVHGLGTTGAPMLNVKI
ncbi:regucalcin-like [Fopius arisanus]|uniref:Regucalcin n=1 Tax=Fopius arisanus TaxID=64838 RepID=A0A9R1TBG5_9HYME|nr:PREDICTED: regucalcin-like [Fopius arisanus]